MNFRTWQRAMRRTDLPKTIMKTFGYGRKRKRPMTYSLLGILGSAAAAYVFRNQLNGTGRFFRNTNMRGNLRSGLTRPMADGLTEFAREITSGINGKWKNDGNRQNDLTQHTSQATHTSPESDELISQIGSTAQVQGNGQQVENLTNKLIKTNVNKK